MQPEQLGPYRIVRQLGKGGMGAVYEGCHRDSGHRVAIKVLKPQLAQAEGFRERFEAEIESLKKLRHAAIVRLYGYGEQDGCLYYSMELVEGLTLEHQLRAGRRYHWREVTQIGIQVARALKHAHDHGVIHRDIKPANLLVTEQGEVKLSDFGIARIFGGNRLTVAGGVLGTAEYMAPEQAGGEPVDTRSDQYSLGCVLYSLLAGRPPFRASGMPELLQLQRFAEPEPVRSFAPAAPEELERIITQLLAKNPARRFRNTLVLARRLEAMLRALGRVAEPPPPSTAGESQGRSSADHSGVEETRVASCGGVERRAAAQPASAAAAAPRDHHPTIQPAAAGRDVPPTPGRIEKDHFTTIEEAERYATLDRREPVLQSVAHGLLLVIGLLLLVTVVWYFARAPSADAIYAEISAAVVDDQVDSLLKVERAIDEFVRRFPADPRTAEIINYQTELELAQVDRRLQSRARRGSRAARLTPVEQMYVTALRLVGTDPDRALAHFEALIDLYDDHRSIDHNRQPAATSGRSESARAGQLLTLARRQLEQLRQQVDQMAREHRKILEARLDHADQIRATDLQRARRIWRGIDRLYGDKVWAADLVARARAELASATAQAAGEGQEK